MEPTVQSSVNPALAALKDIQLPEAVGFWPLAPGYWISLLIVITILIFGSIWLVRRKRQLLARKLALTELAQLPLTTKDYPQKINTLLKRAVLSYLPRKEVAALDGDDWYLLLDSQLPTNKQGQFKSLLNRRFSAQDFSNEQAQELKKLAEYWLKKALPLDIGNTKVQEALC